MRVLNQQVQALYKALGHEGFYSICHCQDVEKNKLVGREIVFGVSEVLKFAQKYNGQGNVFLSRNPVSKEGKVERILNITFDLDPADYDKGAGATKGQIQSCISAGRAILENYPGGWLAFSGNGVLVGYPFPSASSYPLEQFSSFFKRFAEAKIKPIVDRFEGVKLDDLFDDERLLKLVGTVSCRGERRYARFLVFPSSSPDCVGLVEDFGNVTAQGKILPDSAGTERKPSVSSNQPNAPKIAHPHRQRYLVSLAGSLHRRGLSEAVIFAAVKSAYLENCLQVPPKDDAKLLNIVQTVMKYDNKDGLKGYGALMVEEEPSAADLAVEAVSPEEDLAAYESYLSSKSGSTEPELSTGFKSLDDLCFGFQRGDICTIGAYTGSGKTSLLVNSADALCKAGKKVLYLSTEMGKYQIYDKFFSLNTQTHYMTYLKGNFTETELVKRAEFAKQFKQYKLTVNDSLKLTEHSVRLLLEKKKPDVLIFDHIHEVGNGSQNYYGFLKDFTHALQVAARDFNCAVVLAAQFSRPPRTLDMATGQYKKPPRPTVNSIKACGDIENKSRTVILLYDTYESLVPDVNLMELEVAKCSKGLKGTVRLSWRWKETRFEQQ